MEKNNNISKHSVAIIGGGLSGSLLAINLMRQSIHPIQIFLIETSKKRLGRGIAYSPNSIYQKLNVPAKNMSLFPEEPSHFYDWWKSKLHEYFYLNEDFNENSFFPRFIFGDYLEFSLNQAVINRPNFVEFLSINDEAIDAYHDSLIWRIRLASGAEINVNIAVLATGNIPPSNPPYLSEEVLESKRYLSNPWDESLYDSIQADEKIGILGSGLSMVDVLMTLKKKGFSGEILSLSRSGKLPRVHEEHSILNASDFPSINGKLREDISSIRSWMKNNQHVSEANLLDVMRPKISTIWKKWDSNDQLRFLKHIRPFWETFRHRIPVESMKMISSLMNEGKLNFIKARIKRSILENNKLILITKENGKNQNIYQFDRIINCTGPDTKLKQVKSSLYVNLIQKKYLKSATNGIGFKTISGGRVVSITDEPVENLYALGPLRKNELWESTALREIRSQVVELTSNILEQSYNQFQLKSSHFQKVTSEILNLVPNTQNIEKLVQILEIYSSQEIIKAVENTIGWIRPGSGYSRLRILIEPYELLMMVWAPTSETAIHKHVGFGGALLILQGELIDKKFEIKDGKISLTEEVELTQGQLAFETINSIHQVKNTSLDGYAVSLHLYHPVVNSLTSMEIYDLENNRVGILNEKARSASWNENGLSFQSIRNLY